MKWPNKSTMIGLPTVRSSQCPPLPWKVMQILGQIFAPDDHRRDRAQSASGSAAGLCASCRRYRRLLIGVNLERSIHHESAQALVGHDTRYRDRDSYRNLSGGQKRGAADDACNG